MQRKYVLCACLRLAWQTTLLATSKHTENALKKKKCPKKHTIHMDIQARLSDNKEEVARMYVLLGDIEKRLGALEVARQEKSKLRFSFTNTPPAQQVKGNDAQDGYVTLEFQVGNAHTDHHHQAVYVVGNLDELGAWNLSNAVPLSTTPATYPNWLGSISVRNQGETVSLKFCKLTDKDPSTVIWDNHENYVITPTPGDGSTIKKVVEWCN